MITLCMDTSNKFLILSLIRDDKIVSYRNINSWKRQSELIFPELIKCLEEAHISSHQINQVVVTKGPGSYTGVRIAMTVAKVMCKMGNIPLYTLSSLQLIASNKEEVAVVMDARGKRGYFAIYKKGVLIGKESALSVDEIKSILDTHMDLEVLGDASILGLEDNYPNLCQSFLDLKSHWQLQENVDLLVPEYLKSNEEYLVKKS